MGARTCRKKSFAGTGESLSADLESDSGLQVLAVMTDRGYKVTCDVLIQTPTITACKESTENSTLVHELLIQANNVSYCMCGFVPSSLSVAALIGVMGG